MNRLMFVFSLLLTASAFSAEAGELVKELKQCKEVTNSEKRLACFDAINVPLASTKESVVTQPEVAQEPEPTKTIILTKQEFGLKNIVKEPEYISLTVEKVKKNAYGELTVYLKEGQIWKQKDGGALRLKTNDKVIIKTGAFNSFNMMKASGSRTMRVKRIK